MGTVVSVIQHKLTHTHTMFRSTHLLYTTIAVKGMTKADVKGVTKAEVKGVTKAEVKGVTKAEVKGVTKAEVKGEVKGEVHRSRTCADSPLPCTLDTIHCRSVLQQS